MKYLKTRQEYVDQYDRITVEKCRWASTSITPELVEKHDTTKRDKAGFERVSHAFNELHVWFVAGEMYSKKEETISKWMEKDAARDRFLERAQPPIVNCLTCNREMNVTSKHLDTSLDDKDRVLFMYDCILDHLPRRSFYDNGEEWKYKKPLCEKCGTPVDITDEDTEEVWKSVLTCSRCGHVKVNEIERTANKEEEIDPNFEKDRERFCSEKEGMKYVEWIRTAHELSDILDKKKEKEENRELYDRVTKLQKLTIPQVKDHLTQALKSSAYSNLVFDQPLIERIVSISFSVEDLTDQAEYDSRTKLTRLLKDSLEETNWRLMTDGITYRLGFLQGRIRVYEKEEEIVKLLK